VRPNPSIRHKLATPELCLESEGFAATARFAMDRDCFKSNSIKIQEIHQARLSSSKPPHHEAEGEQLDRGATFDCYDGEQPQTHAARTAPRLIFHELFPLRTTLPPHVVLSKHAGTWYPPRKSCECNTPSRRPRDSTKCRPEVQTGFTLHIFYSLYTIRHILPLPAIAVLYAVNLFAWALGAFLVTLFFHHRLIRSASLFYFFGILIFSTKFSLPTWAGWTYA